MKNVLRELRAARMWSQSHLAEQLGVSRQTVNAIETERYDASLPLAFKIARLFEKRIEDIFTDTGEFPRRDLPPTEVPSENTALWSPTPTVD